MLASSILTMMLLPKQLQTFPHSMQQPGQWAAHLTRGVDILVACYTCTEALAEIYQIRIENQQKRKEGHNPDRMKGKKGGGREGGREGRKGREGKGREGRKEGRTAGREKQRPSCKMLCALSHLHMLLSKSCRSQTICKRWFQNVAKTVQFTDFSRNTLQTPCHYLQSANDNFKILRMPITYRFELQKVVKIASNLPTSISKCCACQAVYQ